MLFSKKQTKLLSSLIGEFDKNPSKYISIFLRDRLDSETFDLLYAHRGDVKAASWLRSLTNAVINNQVCSVCGERYHRTPEFRVCVPCLKTPEGTAVRKEFESKRGTANAEATQIKLIERYGVSSMMLVPGAAGRRVGTILREYGVSCPLDIDRLANARKHRENFQKKHGVDHPMQLKEVFMRAHKQARNARPFNLGKRVVQGQGYEPEAAVVLVEKYGARRVKHQSEIGSRLMYEYGGAEHYFFPDFTVKGSEADVHFEVKSHFTLIEGNRLEINVAKARANPDVRWLLVRRDHEVVLLPKEWHQKSRRNLVKLLQ